MAMIHHWVLLEEVTGIALWMRVFKWQNFSSRYGRKNVVAMDDEECKVAARTRVQCSYFIFTDPSGYNTFDSTHYITIGKS